MTAAPKIPPAWFARTTEVVRGTLQAARQRLAPAPVTMLEMINGAMLTQAITVAARLGVADQLAEGPLTSAEIARRVGAHPDGVHRLLRALASQGVFATGPGGTNRLTPLAETLRTDAPVSLRSWAMFTGAPEHWEDWSHLIDSVRTGEAAVPQIRGMDVWAYFDSNPEYAALFNDAMTSISDFTKKPLLAAFDFAPFATIVDVGGGHGALLAAILRQTPNARGVLFDQPSVVAGAGDVLRAHGVEARCRTESGSFFDGVPGGGDAYLLKNVIHDWPEPEALTILRNVRKVLGPTGRLLLVELVLPEGDAAHPGKLIDLEMLLSPGGRERTEREYREFVAEAGFQLIRVVPTASPLSVVECAPC